LYLCWIDGILLDISLQLLTHGCLIDQISDSIIWLELSSIVKEFFITIIVDEIARKTCNDSTGNSEGA
jgi:hypothetical protein